MTIADKIALFKKCVSTTDDVAQLYLARAGEAILNKMYPFKDTEPFNADPLADVPNKYGNLQVEIGVYLYNKQGAEGETAHDENGIKRTYESASVPDSMLKYVIPKAKVF